ncbi:MAG TPA: flagellar motor switch protein FliN [Acidimicrobiales bacterium]|nr:flagellar motor switch protein FliN [Acidimicrobiales bacterium]
MNDENTGAGAVVGATAGAVAEYPLDAPAIEPATPPLPEPDAGRVAMRPLETLSNVELAVTVELGRTRLLMKDLLSLRPGSVVELDRHVGSPVDVYVNSTLLAHGEVVVVDDELGVRITAIDSGTDETQGA